MTQDRHLAVFNWGVLSHDWDAPEVADFVNGLEKVNNAASRYDGFVWRLGDADMEAAQLSPDGLFGGNPRLASTLSVWRDAESLKSFVYNSVHKLFYARRAEWFAQDQGPRMVMWFVTPGTRPSISDADARATHMSQHGDSEFGFGWNYLKDRQDASG